MRCARSYSIVDHALYHGGYLHRLSHEALALYLFLLVVGDREGKSFHGEATVIEILRLTVTELDAARTALLSEGLIAWRRPYWWVKSLSGSPAGGQAGSPQRSPSKPPPRGVARSAQVESADGTAVDRETARSRIRDLVESLSSPAAQTKRREGR